MKLKLLLLFLLVLGSGALVNAQKKPYNNLIITEARMDGNEQNYVELSNMGSETIDLSEFELGVIGAWTVPWTWEPARNLMLPHKMLAPGKSFVIATACDFEPENWKKDPVKNRQYVTKPEMYKLADLMMQLPEVNSNKNDSITPKWWTMDLWDGSYCWYLKHIYTIDGVKDSMLIDQVGGIFSDIDGSNLDLIPTDVAGYKDATNKCVLVRRASVKTGISDFTSHDANATAALSQFKNNKGLDYADSEWIPVPFLITNRWWEGWRAAFWTVGNQGDNKLDANTLVPKTGSKVIVDLNNSIITVPWGIRNDDSIMYQFNRRRGLAWHYDYAPTIEDSAFISARTGDKLTLYVCGNEVAMKTFTIKVLDPSPSANIVIPKNGYDYKRMRYEVMPRPYSDYQVTDGVKGMDTIRYIDFATRVDTLFKYLEKAPKASWKIVFNDGINRPDLKFGDKLRVTSENGTVKDYFLKLDKLVLNTDAFLSSITWPDMPATFKGDIARAYGWKGDTIPSFSPINYNYIVQVPMDYSGIPGLVFHKSQTNSKVVVNRAKSLDGTDAQATVTFTVTAECDTIVKVYTVLFQKEKDISTTQPFIAEPFLSQLIMRESWLYTWVEIVNPGSVPLDLSHYMILSFWGDRMSVFNSWNTVADFGSAYMKYVPGKKWQEQADWAVQPRILETDMATNSIVAPGGVFVMTACDIPKHPFYKEANFNFQKTPWGTDYGTNNNAIDLWFNKTLWLYKITNDSVVNGLKPATDINDFELIETFGSDNNQQWVIAGRTITGQSGFIRKPNIYKGNPLPNGSFGTNLDDSEWIVTKFEDPGVPDLMTGIGSHFMNPVTVYKSTVSSVVYKVSSGYSNKETIIGLKTGITASGFYANIFKANELQTLKVKSATTGNELANASAISKGDTLIVLSGDSVNTSKYILDVTADGISSNALLTSTLYTINVSGTTGTIGGFDQGTLLKNVLSGVVIPAGATLTMTDANDAYMTLTKLNYDTAYINSIATDAVYFEVIAENGINKVLYQLTPTSNPGDAYVTSDVYSVDQFASLIQFVPDGTTVPSLMDNVYPAPGATMAIYDKAGFVRSSGTIYRDDKLMVTSSDKKVTKAYYFAMLNFHVNTYFAYVISDDYQINQVTFNIAGPKTNTSLAEFEAKLYPSFGATLKVLDNNGIAITGNLSKGAQLMVTAADGLTTATYNIDVQFPDIALAPVAEPIKMYPNPTTEKVIINGLAKGNRVRVFNSVGVTLRDVIVENSNEYVSLSAQPAGIYIFVISSGDQNINIQKIVKK